jgi:Glycosyl hydrolases family 43
VGPVQHPGRLAQRTGRRQHNLREWSQPVDALSELPAWAEWGHTWAPGVLPRDSGFVLYFAARSRTLGLQCIGAATAQSIEGPYSSPDPEPLVCQPHLGASIDPQPFVDRDGTAYLLWTADANAIGQTSGLFAQRLRQDGLVLAGDEVALLRSDAQWEWPLIENPALLAVDGAYVLVYSGGWWDSDRYAPAMWSVTHLSARARSGPPSGQSSQAQETRPAPAAPRWLRARSANIGSLTTRGRPVRSATTTEARAACASPRSHGMPTTLWSPASHVHHTADPNLQLTRWRARPTSGAHRGDELSGTERIQQRW